MESYYRFKMNDHMELSPGVQFVSDPGGDADADGVTVFGVRLQVAF